MTSWGGRGLQSIVQRFKVWDVDSLDLTVYHLLMKLFYCGGVYGESIVDQGKAILRCFELALSLKINFSNSRLVGVNVDGSHLSLVIW